MAGAAEDAGPTTGRPERQVAELSGQGTTPPPDPMQILGPKANEIKEWISGTWDPKGLCLPVCDECVPIENSQSKQNIECRVLSDRVNVLSNLGMYAQFFNQGPYPVTPENWKSSYHIFTCAKRPTVSSEKKFYIWHCLPVDKDTVLAWIEWLVSKKGGANLQKKGLF
mmetsp:Transcript_92498/g.261561  ORF Transcript_92498/g.261561 Transcript_92498/m.261561 type:complete len:168 (-) Transcript_92498:110-613(-)